MGRLGRITALAILALTAVTVSAQEQWVIEFNNGTFVHYNIKDIRQMYISTEIPEPEAQPEASDLHETASVSIWQPQCVDLGLSVKWATCNVGTEVPERFGTAVSWGEVKPRQYPNWTGYKYSRVITSRPAKYGVNMMTKYCVDSLRCIAIDGKTVLEPEDDLAHVSWGSGWRTPTRQEFAELMDTLNCTWTWYDKGNEEFKGVAGFKVQSNREGYTDNFIFLPANGSSISQKAATSGFYWTSSLFAGDPDYEDDSSFAWYVNFNSKEPKLLSFSRYFKYFIRPVHE